MNQPIVERNRSLETIGPSAPRQLRGGRLREGGLAKCCAASGLGAPINREASTPSPRCEPGLREPLAASRDRRGQSPVSDQRPTGPLRGRQPSPSRSLFRLTLAQRLTVEKVPPLREQVVAVGLGLCPSSRPRPGVDRSCLGTPEPNPDSDPRRPRASSRTDAGSRPALRLSGRSPSSAPTRHAPLRRARGPAPPRRL